MKSYKRKEFALPILLLMGSGIALVTVIALSLVLSIISYYTKNPTALVGALALLALALSGAISGFINSRIGGDGGALVGTVSALLCALVMLVIGLIWRGGLLPLGAILNLGVFVTLSAFSALLTKRTARRPRKRRY